MVIGLVLILGGVVLLTLSSSLTVRQYPGKRIGRDHTPAAFARSTQLMQLTGLAATVLGGVLLQTHIGFWALLVVIVPGALAMTLPFILHNRSVLRT